MKLEQPPKLPVSTVDRTFEIFWQEVTKASIVSPAQLETLKGLMTGTELPSPEELLEVLENRDDSDA